MAVVSIQGYQQFLVQQYWSPIWGLRALAAGLLRERGYCPDDRVDLVGDVELALFDGMNESVRDVLADNGLPACADGCGRGRTCAA